MFKFTIKSFLLFACILFLGSSIEVKAQTQNQSIVVSGVFNTTYYFSNSDIELNTIFSASSGLPVSYSSDNLAVATIVNGKIRPVGVGTFNLTVSQAGNGTYLPAPNIVTSITFVKGFQYITFPALPAKSISSPDFSPGASSDSGLPIIYTSSNENVAEIVGGMIRVKAQGSTVITASQPGNANFVAAPNETQTLHVSPNAQTITILPITKRYLDPNFSLTATTSSGLPISTYTSSNPAVATILSNNIVKINGVGTTTITATQDGSALYQSASATTTLTVNKANQSIFLNSNATAPFNTPDFSPGGSASSNLPITYITNNPAVATIVDNKIHTTGVGTAIISANQAGDANYEAAPVAFQTLTITKANQTITFPDISSKNLGAADFDPGATSNSGLAITYTSSNPAVATIVGGNIHIVGLGITSITASQAGDANFNAAESVTKQFSVSNSIQTITFPAIPVKNIGDEDFDPGATASSNLPVTYTSSNTSVATIVGNRVRIISGGTSIITATQLGDINFSAASATSLLTVNKKTQTISFSPFTPKTRSDADFHPGAVANSNLPVTYTSSNLNVAIIVDNMVRLVGAGTTNITASQAGNSIYDAATPVVQALVVGKGDQIINFPVLAPKTLADVDFDPSATSNSGLQVTYSSSNTAVATIVSGKIHIVGIGTTTITANQAGDVNWNPATATRTFSVISLTQTISFPPIPSLGIGDPDYDPGATVASGLPVTYTTSNPAIADIVGNKIRAISEGPVIITANQPGNGVYSAATPISRTIIITKRTQTISFPIIPTKILGDADFPTGATINSGLTINYSVGNPAVATVVGGMIKINGVGTTTITASQPGDATYLAATSVTRTLTVTGSIAQTITFPALGSKPYSLVGFSTGATSNSGLPLTYTSSDPSVAAIVGNQINTVGIGTATITAYQAGNENYSPASATSVLTVIKGTASISFPAIPTKIMNNPDFDGFALATANLPIVYSSADHSIATIVNNKIKLVGVGTTTITASHAGNAVYNPNSASQSLTVTQGFQTITFPNIPQKNPTSPSFDPGATVNSGLPITYSSSNNAIASVVGNMIQINGMGIVEITASQAGNLNYTAAIPVVRTLVVSKSPQSITFPIIPAKSLGIPSFNANAIATSGLPVTLTSSNPAVATVAGDVITIVGLGSTTITASQPGDATFTEAAAVSRVLNVSANTQIIALAPTLSKEFGSPDFNLPATSSAGLEIIVSSNNPAVASIVEGKVRLNSVGTAILTATQYGNSEYAGATANTTLTVTKANQTITFPELTTKKMGDPDFLIGASLSSGLTPIYNSSNTLVAQIIGNRIQIVGVGTTVITATHPGDNKYNAALSVNRTLTVTKGTQIINFPDFPSKSITDVDFPHGITVNSGLPLTVTSSNPAVATIVGNNVHIVGMGNTTITASQAGNIAYDPAVSVSKVLTIKGYAQVMTFNPISDKQLGDPDFDPAATVNTGLPITYSSSNTNVATIVNGKVRIVGGGTVTITASQAGDETYAATSISRTFSVAFEAQTITFPEIGAKALGTADFDPGATASSGLAVVYTSSNPAVATIVNGKIHLVGIGSTTITATQPGDFKYGAATPIERVLNVTNGVQTITFPPIGIKYHNDAPFQLEATASSGLAVSYSSSNTSVATINGNMVQLVGPGSTTITATQDGNANFAAATPVTQTLEVKYSLPTTNFSLQITDVACKGNTNGIISITAVQNLNYSVNITGNGKNVTQSFTTSTSIPNLGAGTYKVTISLEGSAGVLQSYDVTVKEPKDLSAYANVKEAAKEVTLKLDGASLYNIDVNGRIYTTSNTEITVPLNKGNNLVKISSDKICQGVIEKTFMIQNTLSIYPNPVVDELNINTGNTDAKSVKVDIHGLDGRLVYSRQLTPSYGQVKINLGQLNKGVYILSLTIGKDKTVHKVVKQ